MLSSTFVALRTQGIDTDQLRKSCIAHFLEAAPLDIVARDRFWKEFVRSRRVYREATDENLERALART